MNAFELFCFIGAAAADYNRRWGADWETFDWQITDGTLTIWPENTFYRSTKGTIDLFTNDATVSQP